MKTRWTPIIGAGVLLVGLAGCGPGNVNSAANSAAATAAAVAPAGAAATVQAAASDATVQAAANEAMATAQAVASDATVQAAANEAVATAAAAAADPAVQSAVDQAFQGMNDRATIAQGQALALSALSSIPDVQSWKMTIEDAPAAAAASKGKVIKEASGGNISLNPDDYNKYFTAPGDYKVRLDVTTAGNKTASHVFTVTAP